MKFEDFKSNFSEQLMEDEGVLIDENTLFRQLASWDSLTAMAVMAMIEDVYSVIITSQEFKACKTVGEIFETVKSKQ